MVQAADIKRLLDAFENSDWEEIRLSIDGTDVLISANDKPAAIADKSSASARPTSVVSAITESETKAEAIQQSESDAKSAAAVDIPDGEAVRSTSPGIFWRSPAPGAPPFVEIGQRVETDSVICIVEVMKLMNRVHAGVAGTVVAILVENSDKVARDQALVIIDPDK